MTTRNPKAVLALIPALFALAVPAGAQTAATTAPTAPAHAPNAIQRHPTMTGIAAGVATHHALKVAARNAKMHHKHLNFAERHPTLTGIAAGVATHHEIKAHTAH